LLCGGRDYFPLNSFVLNDRRFHTVRCTHDGGRAEGVESSRVGTGSRLCRPGQTSGNHGVQV
jgi:hypothetical protein